MLLFFLFLCLLVYASSYAGSDTTKYLLMPTAAAAARLQKSSTSYTHPPNLIASLGGTYKRCYHVSILHANSVDMMTATSSPTSASELPDDFQDCVQRAVQSTVRCINTGSIRCRVDFDTTVGDMTYSTLKNTIPFIQEYVKLLAFQMGYAVPMHEESANQEEHDNTEQVLVAKNPENAIRIFFPDMGAAALARKEWKLGEEGALLPTVVFTANIKNDPILSSDKIVIALCPQYSEADNVKRLMFDCQDKGVVFILVNPNIINMDQGFGVRARNLRSEVLDTFITTFKLRTLKEGAVIREWPKQYGLWIEDSSVDGGYSLVQASNDEPRNEDIADLFEEIFAKRQGKDLKGNKKSVINGVIEFFQGLSKL